MHCVHIASECAPIAKVGGLSDVVLGLGRALHEEGHRVEVVLPHYESIQTNDLTNVHPIGTYRFHFRGQEVEITVQSALYQSLRLLLIRPKEQAELFSRGQIYGYNDDEERFSFFAYAALQFLTQSGRAPQIIHLHDWQTALCAPLIKDHFHHTQLGSAKIVYTIHNLAHQGQCRPEVLDQLGICGGHYLSFDKLQDPHALGKLNLMKGGITYADAITTVSPSYAREIQSPEGGHGLDAVLRAHASKLRGLLNGIDADFWNPNADTFLEGKVEEQKRLLRLQFGLDHCGKPLVVCISRLVPQKGLHLIQHAMKRTLAKGGQFFLMGTSPIPQVQHQFSELARKIAPNPDACIWLESEETLAHRLFAAADIVIVPSLFEPCGLTQLIALRYGALPVVRATGGLQDTVFDLDYSLIPHTQRNGFVFNDPDPKGVNSALDRALSLYKEAPEVWSELTHRVAQIDHSWNRACHEYVGLYKSLLQRPAPPSSEGLFSTMAAEHWRKVGLKHHHGIATPLSALRSRESCGIGEYLDLIPLLSWQGKCGLKVLQLLPINDTGEDPSPYNALSATALHPIYLSLRQLPGYEKDAECRKIVQELSQINRRKRIPYRKVLALKERFLERYVKAHLSDEEIDQFAQKNPELITYAQFKALKTKEQMRPWQRWSPKWQHPTERELSTLSTRHHLGVQLLCARQLQQVRQLAESLGIKLMADLPILMSPDSADVWRHQELFINDLTAGAPPDQYSPHGQRWNFPIYNWEALEEQNFAWWENRLKACEQWADLYRLDHVVGFFRLWTLKAWESPRKGRFYPEDPEEWLPQGEMMLSRMLAKTQMLPVGEDLGAIPSEVRSSLQSLGISTMKVLRWERDYGHDRSFLNPDSFHPASLTTVSTHDSESLAHWWSAYPEDAIELSDQFGWNYTPELSRDHHFELISQSHTSNSLLHVNLFHEYFPLIEGLGWKNPEDDRINRPGTVNQRNWSFRHRRYLEEIIEHGEFERVMRDLSGSQAPYESPR